MKVIMSTSFVLNVILIVFSVVQSYDFTVCLTRIELDSYWYSDTYGVDPYAIVYVDDVEQSTTQYESGLEVNYGSSEYCVQLNENSEYKVQLLESEYGPDYYICWKKDSITAAADVGLNQNSCTDSYGYNNFMDFYVYQNTQPTPEPTNIVSIDNVEYKGTAMNFQYNQMLSSCEAACESDNNCNYLSYGKIDGNTNNMCRMYTTYDNAIKNENAVSVSYMCTVENLDSLGSGTCTGATGYNVEDCGWDGGDCCMATNSKVLNNDNCLDPLNQYIPPTYTTTRTATTTTEFANTNTITNDLTLCKFILDNVGDNINFGNIGDYICDTDLHGFQTYSYYYNGFGGSTTLNDETCDWDGGDCCMATNPSLSTNEYCLDPRYSDIATTTSTTTTSSTTTTVMAGETKHTANGAKSCGVLRLIIAVITMVVMINACFGDVETTSNGF
eukprot:242810_1